MASKVWNHSLLKYDMFIKYTLQNGLLNKTAYGRIQIEINILVTRVAIISNEFQNTICFIACEI